MKKTLLILFTCLAFSLAVNAQRSAHLKVKLTDPGNKSYIPSQKTFKLSAVIYNMDTVHIGNDDTLRLYLIINGDSLFFSDNGGGIINHLNLYNKTLNPGDSFVFNNTMAFDKSYDNLSINLCVFAKPFNLARPVIDADLSDNKSCAIIFVREKNSEIENIGTKADPVHIYPNPARDHFNISSKESVKSIMVTDIEGRRTDLVIPVSGTVDCSTLTAGIYIISVATESGIYTVKIAVQH